MLLAHPGIEVNKPDIGGFTPLCLAVAYNMPECVRLLLAAPGIDVNACGDNGTHPLWQAAMCGNLACMQQLLAAPALDAQLANTNGVTPLSAAAAGGHPECVRVLLPYYTPVDVWTAMYLAIIKNQTSCMEVLFSAPGVDVRWVDKQGRTLLDRAALCESPEPLRKLQELLGRDSNHSDI